jgi:hypothetical protein
MLKDFLVLPGRKILSPKLVIFATNEHFDTYNTVLLIEYVHACLIPLT